MIEVGSGGAMIHMTFNCEALRKMGIVLGKAPKEAEKAVQHAVNRAMDHYKTISIRETASKYYAKQKDIRQSVKVVPAKPGSLRATLCSRGKRKSLAHYMIRPQKGYVKPGTFRGAVAKAGGLKPIPLAYLQPARGAMLPAIRDKAKGGFGVGIRFLMSPSIPQLMKNEETVNKAQEEAATVFENRLEHEVERLLKSWGALP